jgi:hypothetical protein
MSYNLFLDDIREPINCRNYKGDNSIYDSEQFIIVRTFNEFYLALKEYGVPKFVSFDYDLGVCSDNGLKCAELLKFWCDDLGVDFPKYRVHSSWPNIRIEFDKIIGK